MGEVSLGLVVRRSRKGWDKANAYAKQTCWVWCPTCRNELTADDESLYHYEMGLVVYGCAECGTVSKWDLRDAPAPLLIESKEPR